MTIYICMLRGINVGEHKRIKMDRLRASFEALGFEQVRTYIQSGNVIFITGKVSTPALCRRIENKLLQDFGFPVSVVVRSADDMARAVKNNPFLKEQGVDLEKLHVVFLSGALLSAAVNRLAELTAIPDRSCCVGTEIYLLLPNGTAESSLMKRPLDRVLAVVTTTRNWRTVNTLQQMCQDCR
jgi:uncharacterized protein (DUF1697 family)